MKYTLLYWIVFTIFIAIVMACAVSFNNMSILMSFVMLTLLYVCERASVALLLRRCSTPWATQIRSGLKINWEGILS